MPQSNRPLDSVTQFANVAGPGILPHLLDGCRREAAYLTGGWPITPSRTALLTLPTVIANVGDNAAIRFVEFFTANISNPNTRAACAQAVCQFLRWCEEQNLAFKAIQPIHVATYVEQLRRRAQNPLSDPSVKQHLAAIKMFFDWMVTGQVIPMNPAASVRGPKHVVKKGKTPVLSAPDARKLLDNIPTRIGPEPKEGEQDNRPPDLIGLRDRALIAIMSFSFARIGAVLQMRAKDYCADGKRWRIRLHEKGGKFHEVPVHQCGEKYLKGLLEELGLAIPKTHDLEKLLTLLLPHHPSLRSMRRGLAFLTNFAVGVRYPTFTASKRQAVSALRWKDRVRTAARILLGIRVRRKKGKKSP